MIQDQTRLLASLVRNFRLLLIKIALGLITKDFNKIDKNIEDFIVNIDLDLTSSLIIYISKLKLPRITKAFQLIILLIYQLSIETLIEIGIIIVTLDLTTLLTIILIEIVTQNSFLIVIRISINFYRVSINSFFKEIINFLFFIINNQVIINQNSQSIQILYNTLNQSSISSSYIVLA